MKNSNTLRRLFFLMLTMICTHFGIAQTAHDFFNSTDVKVTYLGIDFSDARVIGDASTTAAQIKDIYFSTINEIILAEPLKYPLATAFRKSSIGADLSFVQKKNGKADVEKIKSLNAADASRFTPATIDQMVAEYNFGDNKGLGLLFIMEGMNKTENMASLYVTLVDMGTKKVLFKERMTGKSGGFGFRNYWAHSIFMIIKEINEKKFKEWQANAK